MKRMYVCSGRYHPSGCTTALKTNEHLRIFISNTGDSSHISVNTFLRPEKTHAVFHAVVFPPRNLLRMLLLLLLLLLLCRRRRRRRRLLSLSPGISSPLSLIPRRIRELKRRAAGMKWSRRR